MSDEQTRTYTVLWTHVANYSDRPVEVVAASPLEAIKKAFPQYYEVRAEMNFLVFEGKMVAQSKAWYGRPDTPGPLVFGKGDLSTESLKLKEDGKPLFWVRDRPQEYCSRCNTALTTEELNNKDSMCDHKPICDTCIESVKAEDEAVEMEIDYRREEGM